MWAARRARAGRVLAGVALALVCLVWVPAASWAATTYPPAPFACRDPETLVFGKTTWHARVCADPATTVTLSRWSPNYEDRISVTHGMGSSGSKSAQVSRDAEKTWTATSAPSATTYIAGLSTNTAVGIEIFRWLRDGTEVGRMYVDQGVLPEGIGDPPAPTSAPTPTPTPTPVPSTSAPTPTPVPSTSAPTPTPVPSTSAPTPTPVPSTSAPTPTPVPSTSAPDPTAPGSSTPPSPAPSTSAPTPSTAPTTSAPSPSPTETATVAPSPTAEPSDPPSPYVEVDEEGVQVVRFSDDDRLLIAALGGGLMLTTSALTTSTLIRKR